MPCGFRVLGLTGVPDIGGLTHVSASDRPLMQCLGMSNSKPSPISSPHGKVFQEAKEQARIHGSAHQQLGRYHRQVVARQRVVVGVCLCDAQS